MPLSSHVAIRDRHPPDDECTLPPFGAETWRSAERPMVAQNRTLCASAARRVSGRLRSFQVLGRAAWDYKAAVIRSLRPITRAADSAGPSSASAWQASSFSQAAQVDGGPSTATSSGPSRR